MNKGGGFRGGSGRRQSPGTPSGNGRGREAQQTAAQVRFPSDHSGRHDDRQGPRFVLRFPSDSNAKDHDALGARVQGYFRDGHASHSDDSRRHPGTTSGLDDATRSRDSRWRSGASNGYRHGSQDEFHRRREARPMGQTRDFPASNEGITDDVALPPTDQEHTRLLLIDPFELFSAYYLGLSPNGAYKPANISDVAKRFGVTPGGIRQALHHHQMDPDTILNCEFDMAMAQVDIQVSPPGVSKTEIARNLFDEFLSSRRSDRVWVNPTGETADAGA